MDQFNDWAIREWPSALSDDFPLDKASFLLASLIPISYIEMIGMENLVVVDLETIRKATKLAKNGCDYLVSKGLAKWVVDNSSSHDDGKQQISIGTSPNFTKCVYYFEKTNRIAAIAEIPSKDDGVDYSTTIAVLDDLFEKYKNFCKKVKLHSKPEKVHEKIKRVILLAKAGKLTNVDLLTYLDCVNAMVYDWKDVPDKYNDHKARAVAKKIVDRITVENIINAVPYFVQNYHTWAKAGYEETNIYMLEFHINATITKMNGRKRATPKTYDNDSLA